MANKSKSTPAKAAPVKEETKVLATKSKVEKPLALSTSIADQIFADAGMGQADMGREDYAIPRLTILQDLSPQVKKTETGFIKGAETGNICDILNEKLMDGEKGIEVIPVSYRRCYLEWRPRGAGGGLVKDWGTDASVLEKCTRGEKGENILPSKNTISVVAEYFVFLVNGDDEYVPYVISMSGSQLKKARRWNSIMNQLRVEKPGGGSFNPAMFYQTYLLTTTPERNEQGSWFGWKIAPKRKTIDIEGGDEIYLAARDFFKSINDGKVTAAPANHEEHGSGGGGGASTESDDSPM